MKTKAISSALSEAKHELKEIGSQIEALAIKREHLQEFIASGEKLAGKIKRPDSAPETQLQTAPPNQTRQPVPINGHKQEVWEKIADSLRKTGRPMSPRQIVEAMQRFGTPVSGNFPRDNVRSALNRKDEVFEKVAPGFFGLREWPTEMKQVKQTKVQ